MRTVPPALAAHLALDVTSCCICWVITRRDGVKVYGTEHDRDVEITLGSLAGLYLERSGISGSSIRSSSGLEVDNMEVQGAFPEPGDLRVDLEAADVEAGLYDEAEAITFLCNFEAPDDGQLVLRRGFLGRIRRTSEGAYTSELRGLAQKLTQIPIRTYGVGCDADLGDSRCKFNLSAGTASGVVTTVSSRRRFDSTLVLGTFTAVGDFVYGLLTFTSGENAGFSREVKRDAVNGVLGELEFMEPFPLTVAPGDAFSLIPGCDKLADTCIGKFDNLLNFRGHGRFVPGQNEVLKIGGQ